MKKRAILVITDGIGFKPESKANAFESANKKAYKYLFENIPYSLVQTHGLSVGLPEGQMGNSEVGHMTLGSGRILYQDLVKISMAIEKDTLKENQELKNLIDSSKRIHIIGLMSDGGVHSHIEHIKALAKISKESNREVFLHLITDGRDVSPTSGVNFIDEIEAICDDSIKIATLSGRFYTMDRDSRWDRVKKGYDAIAFGEPKNTKISPKKYIQNSYEISITDEFLEPVNFIENYSLLDGDGFIFANFRSDRMREIVSVIGDKNFNEFPTSKAQINLVTITEYSKDFPYPVMFKKDSPKNILAEVISKNNLTQLHTAETEKYAHVTFFFNGGIDEPFENESRVLIPSPKVQTYDLKPEMSAKEVGEAVLKALDSEIDFIVVNFANGDMVGHTGNFQSAIKAVEAVDCELEKIIQKAKEKNYSLVLTSDHGNCEEMIDSDGNMLTNHTVGDVWCFVMADGVSSVKDEGLNNIAPTILKLLDLEIPSEMDEPLI